MQFRLFIIAALMFATLMTTYAVPAKGQKCTRNDPRKLYRRCMTNSTTKTLFCDQSNYTVTPNISLIRANNSAIKATTTLLLNDSCIRNFSEGDLKIFHSLEFLNAGKNLISRLFRRAFIDNKKLKILDLRYNQISRIDTDAFEGTENLAHLYLEHNLLTELPNSQTGAFPSLKELCLNSNRIAVLNRGDVRHLQSLEILRIQENILNFIEDSTFDGMDSLTHLYLDGNRLFHITEKTFAGLNNLQLLTLSHNRIESWPTAYEETFVNLHTIHLGSNQLRLFTKDHVRNMSKLQNLSLDNNSLSGISEDLLTPLKRLRYLNLSNNYLEEIPRQTFSSLCYLSVLIISQNKIRTPHSEWFQHFATGYNPEQQVNLTGNSWQCDCDVIPYQTYVDGLTNDRDAREFANKIEITCSSPKYARDKILDDVMVEEIKFRTTCRPPTTAPSPTPCVGRKCNFTERFTNVPFVASEIYPPKLEQHNVPDVHDLTSTVALIGSVTESQGSNTYTPFAVAIPIICAVVLIMFIYYCYKKRYRKRAESIEEGDKKPTRKKRTLSEKPLLESETTTKSSVDLPMNQIPEIVEFGPKSEEDDVFVSADCGALTTAPLTLLPRSEGDGKSMSGTPNMMRGTTIPKQPYVKT